MRHEISELQAELGITFFDHQLEAIEHAANISVLPPRVCFYYPTGKGKTITSLVTMYVWGVTEVLVIAPPSTHPEWKAAGAKVGITVDPVSHAKFRQKNFLLRRDQAVIADEFHLFGGHGGQGWKKLDRLAASLQAPLILASATPNYNDAERVYCIQHVLDPHSVKGGFLQFLYQHCQTEQNPFGMTPNVTGFLRFASAADYLASLPNVLYLPDELQYKITEVSVPTDYPDELLTYGYNRRRHRLVASLMEERHTLIYQGLVAEDGALMPDVKDVLIDLVGNAATPVLVFCNHASIAAAAGATLLVSTSNTVRLVDGKTSAKDKARILDGFRAGELDVLVGTASLATGTDGLDKVSDVLIILDDTDDTSLRRQLIGRIMPRGTDDDATKKVVYRINLLTP